jgi:hypothetical protein
VIPISLVIKFCVILNFEAFMSKMTESWKSNTNVEKMHLLVVGFGTCHLPIV